MLENIYFQFRLEPKKNYILFMKATQIDLVTEKLNECVALHKTHIENLQAEEKVCLSNLIK